MEEVNLEESTRRGTRTLRVKMDEGSVSLLKNASD